MKTFTELKEFVVNPDYLVQRQEALSTLTEADVDEPIRDIITSLNNYSYCFTLQSCYGHFVHSGNTDTFNIEPLSTRVDDERVEYRIAYVAICIENSTVGKELFGVLYDIPKIDPHNIQFCCAEWFWSTHVNSFILQVEPSRFKHEDKVTIDIKEAQNIELVRNKFFDHLRKVFITE